MQIFQSWADIVIMLVLSIAYIVTFIAQRNQIKVLKDNIKSHSDLMNSQKIHIETYKRLFDLDEVEKFMKIKVDVALAKTNFKSENIQKEFEQLKEINETTTYFMTVVFWNLYKALDANNEEREIHMKEQAGKILDPKTYQFVLKGFRSLDGMEKEIQDSPN